MATIQDIRGVNNPQRAYEWEVKLYSTEVGSSEMNILTQRAKSVTIPETSVDTIVINYKSRKAHYAGRSASPSTVTIVFWDDEGHTVYNHFKRWMEERLTKSEVGGGVEADRYTSRMVIDMLKHDSQTVSGQFTLTRVFPISIGDIQLSYDQSEHMEVSVTFSYDSNLIGDVYDRV